MIERNATQEIAGDDCSDDLSDEALDREDGGIRLSYCNGGCAQS